MKQLKKTDRIILIVSLIIVLGLIFVYGPGKAERRKAAKSKPIKKVEYSDYNGKKIGILTGTNMEAESFKFFPDSEYFYYSGYPDMNIALINGSIDAFLGDEPALRRIHAVQPQIDYIKGRLTNNKYSFAFRKDDADEKKLCDQLNAFLKKIKEDGTYDEIDSIWFGTDESKKVVDMSGLDGKNGTIHVVTTSTDEPFSYIKDGKNVGFDIDVVVRFCKEYGYNLELGEVDFSARIPALVSGRYEFTTSLNVTPEREESVLFSDPVSDGGIVVGVRSEDLAEENSGKTLQDYDGKVIGSSTGTTYDHSIKLNLPNAKIKYFNSYGDMVAALDAGKIDGFCADEPVLRYMMIHNDRVAYLPDFMESYEFGYAFPKNKKGKALCDEFSEFIKKIKEDGTLKSLDEKWFSKDEGKQKAADTESLPAKKGRLIMATETENPPFSYIIGGKPAGYEIDIIYLFCKEKGYGLDIFNCRFDAILPSIETGKADLGSSGITITEERAESVYFSEPHYTAGAVLAVRASDLADSSSGASGKKAFFQGILESFEKNFIRENRWKMILQGIGVTCLITLLSAFFGTILAFLICMFRKADSILSNKICDLYVKLLQGTPMVVLLMILYYVIFAHSFLSAVSVAIIGFSLNSAAYISEIMRSGIESIDKGQREAALALGYSEKQTFFKFIFPQAAVHFLPVYRGEIVSLLKSTSIVGYIAIQDLTKMSDIIRSRTYEAFFPLIATAIIYFILAWILSLAIGWFLNHIDPRSARGTKSKAYSKAEGEKANDPAADSSGIEGYAEPLESVKDASEKGGMDQ